MLACRKSCIYLSTRCFTSPVSSPPYRLRTISDLHRLRGFPPPAHPLLSVVDIGTITELPPTEVTTLVADFYLIALKRGFHPHVKTRHLLAPLFA